MVRVNLGAQIVLVRREWVSRAFQISGPKLGVIRAADVQHWLPFLHLLPGETMILDRPTYLGNHRCGQKAVVGYSQSDAERAGQLVGWIVTTECAICSFCRK